MAASACGSSPVTISRRPSIIEPADDVVVPELESLDVPVSPPQPVELIASAPPAAPQVPKARVNRADMRRLLLNINTGRMTTNIDELDNCMEHAYFVLLTLYESNHSHGCQTSYISDMMTIINNIQDTIYEYHDAIIEDEEDLFHQLDPMLSRLRDMYVEFMNQVDIITTSADSGVGSAGAGAAIMGVSV
jgi:hypothetical protein